MKPSIAAQLYSTAVEGNARVQRRYAISGRFDAADYLAFVADRARWLAIGGWAMSPRAGRVEILAGGPEALVGALEMACVLGPLDALVEAVDAMPAHEEAGDDFRLR
jgi:acylphosphatase